MIISVEDGQDPVVVDQLWVVMKKPGQSEELYSEFIPVNYTFRN